MARDLAPLAARVEAAEAEAWRVARTEAGPALLWGHGPCGQRSHCLCSRGLETLELAACGVQARTQGPGLEALSLFFMEAWLNDVLIIGISYLLLNLVPAEHWPAAPRRPGARRGGAPGPRPGVP